jgi:transposase-like protein
MSKFKDSKTSKMKERKHSRGEYLQKKQRKLSSEETQQIRECLEHGQTNVYELANEFGCVPTQIAGLKARLKF